MLFPASPPRRPPGPVARRLTGSLLDMSPSPNTFLLDVATRFGPVSYFRLVNRHVLLLDDPELIRDVLVVQQKHFHKSRGLQFVKLLAGDGLLTLEDDSHLRERRLAAPAFHKPRIAGYANTMVRCALNASDYYVPGTVRDMHHDMMALTLDIVTRTLFGTDIGGEVEEIGRALDSAMGLFSVALLPVVDYLEYLPLPPVWRFKKARARLDQTIYRILGERRKDETDRGDLLSMFLLAKDTDGDGGRMNDQQLRNEAMTMFLAGHETTANALSWTWLLLARHPEVEARFHREVDALGVSPPTLEDLPRLPYTRQILSESMRMYPPAWNVGRKVVDPVTVGGYELPKETVVFVSPWVTHHNPKYFPDPFRFDPDRWTPEKTAALPKMAYFPFGAGTRICIGEAFAWTEGMLLLATLGRSWRFRLDPENLDIQPRAQVTLRPDRPMTMRFEKR